MNAVSLNGQVTIPQDVPDELDIRPGHHVEFVRNRDGECILRKAVQPDAPQSVAQPGRFSRFVGIARPGMSTEEIIALMRGGVR